MNNRISLFNLIAAVGLLFASTSCLNTVSDAFSKYDCTSTGPVVKQQRKASAVDKIDVSRGVSVVFAQGSKPEITVEAPDDIIEYVVTKIDGNELEITTSRNLNQCLKKVKVMVTMPSVGEFDLGSGASVVMADRYDMSGHKVEVDLSSGAAFTAKEIVAGELSLSASSGSAVQVSTVDASELEAEVSSGAAMTLGGWADSVDFEVSSGGVINASDVKASTGSAKATSGGALTCSIKNPTSLTKNSGGSLMNK